MASALILRGALANCGPDASTDDLLDYLVEQQPDLKLFRYSPEPGRIMAAAFDWQGILGTGADLIAYGHLFWGAYRQFVRPRPERGMHDHDPFLFITVQRPNGRPAQFQLGREYQSEEDFIADFERQVSLLRLDEGGPSDLELEWHFSNSVRFVPHRRRRRGHS